MSGTPPRERPLDGLGALVIDAVVGATDLVETMHARISPLQPSPPDRLRGSTRGLTGFVYRCVRGAARLGGRLAGRALRARRSPATGGHRGEAVLAALNGVVGDHLARTANPLAVSMTLRHDGRSLPLERDGLKAALPDATGRIVVLVHGLCMNDLQWRRRGHDHGAALAADLGFTPVYLRYNTGLHTSENGSGLSALLEALLRAWPVAVREIALVGHSMGGLVARSAVHQGMQDGAAWIRALTAVVCLGTPHRGAPLEAAGHRLHRALRWSSFTAPLIRLASVRSAGITDLRRGQLREEDWSGASRFGGETPPATPAGFPVHARLYAIAASLGRRPGDLRDRLLGDTLVPTSSATAAGDERWTAYQCDHLALLDRPEVYARVRDWLGRARRSEQPASPVA